MQGTQGQISLRKLVITGAVASIRPPFRTLLFVEILITLVAATIPSSATDGAAIGGGLVLLIVSAVLQIAILLAAAAPEAGGSADPWIIAAVRRRCFWRFVLARLFVTLMVILGVTLVLLAAARLPTLGFTLIGLAAGLVWGLVLGSVLGVTEQAAVLERRWPFDAMGRSAELTRPSRRPIGILFAIAVVAPSFIGDRLLGVDLLGSLGFFRLLPALIAVIVSTAGLIALTKAYGILGGGEVANAR
jgi:hypothetical protein